MRLFIVLLCIVCAPAFGQVQLGAFCTDASGAPDSKACFDQAVAAACASAMTRTLRYMGDYRFASPPAPIACALNLQGEGKAVSRLLKDYSGQGAYFLKFVAGTDQYGGGSLRDLSILALQASSDGIAVWIYASTDANQNALSYNRHGFLIDNVQIGRRDVGVGSWAHGVYLDGSGNINAAAQGIRAVTIRNTSAAATTVAGFALYYAIGTRLCGSDVFASSGVPVGYYGPYTRLPCGDYP